MQPYHQPKLENVHQYCVPFDVISAGSMPNRHPHIQRSCCDQTHVTDGEGQKEDVHVRLKLETNADDGDDYDRGNYKTSEATIQACTSIFQRRSARERVIKMTKKTQEKIVVTQKKGIDVHCALLKKIHKTIP
jgi:hypothetical protein